MILNNSCAKSNFTISLTLSQISVDNSLSFIF